MYLRKVLFAGYVFLAAWVAYQTITYALGSQEGEGGLEALLTASLVGLPWSALLAFLSPFFLMMAVFVGPGAVVAIYVLTWIGILGNVMFLYRWAFFPKPPYCDLPP